MPSTFSVDTPAGPLSGRLAGPARDPRGLVVALHGGTYDSGYYDTGPGSLLALGEALGLCVIALDRPGYGAAAHLVERWQGFDSQAELITAALRQVSEDVQPAFGTVLVGHSIGGMVALHVAALGQLGLRGVDVSGIGSRWRPGMHDLWCSFLNDAVAVDVPPEAHAELMLGPADSFTSNHVVLDRELLRPLPMRELSEVTRWPQMFPGVAARVSTHVRIAFPEHDKIWMTDEEARGDAARLFERAESVKVSHLAGVGHCTELHTSGPRHCLSQLSFVETCLGA